MSDDAAKEKPWWLQVHGLPPKAAARRAKYWAAVEGMTDAERREYRANENRQWIAKHFLPVTVGLLALSVLYIALLTYDFTNADQDGFIAVVHAVNRFVQAGFISFFWVRWTEASRLPR